jgi:hypothetical protein
MDNLASLIINLGALAIVGGLVVMTIAIIATV